MPAIFDTAGESGRRADQRLREEPVIWLTTVRADGQPQSSPVWFLWDGESFLVFSQPGAAKLRNVAGNPHVSLHLDGDGHGGNIVTVEGRASVRDAGRLEDMPDAYAHKYEPHIARIGRTPQAMAETYSKLLRITPSRARVW